MSLIERFNIQCPFKFLGGSFIRGSTVLYIITIWMKRKVTETYPFLWLPAWHVESGEHPEEKPLPGHPLFCYLHYGVYGGCGHHWCRLSNIKFTIDDSTDNCKSKIIKIEGGNYCE